MTISVQVINKDTRTGALIRVETQTLGDNPNVVEPKILDAGQGDIFTVLPSQRLYVTEVSEPAAKL